MTFKQAVAAVLVPIVAQLLCVSILYRFDPCLNNPQCPPGGETVFWAIMIIPSSFILLIFATLLEVTLQKPSFQTVLKLHTFLAVAPFAVVLAHMTSMN